MSTTKEDQEFGNWFLDDIKEYIAQNYNVDEIFSRKELEEWAEENGYVLGED